MDAQSSFEPEPDAAGSVRLKKGTGGSYGGLKPGEMLSNLFNVVPELSAFANLDLKVRSCLCGSTLVETGVCKQVAIVMPELSACANLDLKVRQLDGALWQYSSE